jgi:hypothetical protein
MSPRDSKDSQVEALELINVARSLEDYESRLWALCAARNNRQFQLPFQRPGL